MGWNINIPFLRSWAKNAIFRIHNAKKDHLHQSRKKQGSHLARSKLTNKISLFEPGSASLSKFEFEPKGSEISSSWRRVRVNYEPSSTVVETISPKNKHFSCNICAIIFYLLYTATAGYLAHFVHNASYAFLCAMEIKPQNNIFLSNKYTFQTIIQNVTNTKSELWKTTRLTSFQKLPMPITFCPFVPSFAFAVLLFILMATPR